MTQLGTFCGGDNDDRSHRLDMQLAIGTYTFSGTVWQSMVACPFDNALFSAYSRLKGDGYYCCAG